MVKQLVLVGACLVAGGSSALAQEPYNLAVPVKRLATLFTDLYSPTGLIVDSLATLPGEQPHSAHLTSDFQANFSQFSTAMVSQLVTLPLHMAIPIVQKMIGAGNIELKNKEERAVFSDTRRFCTEMCSLGTEIRSQEMGCSDLRKVIETNPLLMKMHSMTREKIQLESMLEKERQAQNELSDWSVKIKEKIPALQKELHQKITEIIGENVQLQIDYPTLD